MQAPGYCICVQCWKLAEAVCNTNTLTDAPAGIIRLHPFSAACNPYQTSSESARLDLRFQQGNTPLEEAGQFFSFEQSLGKQGQVDGLTQFHSARFSIGGIEHFPHERVV